MCEDKDGKLITDSRNVLKRWAEHFEELLNGTNREENTTEETNYFGPDFEIRDLSVSEIKDSLKAMKNNKAPGEDNITAELLK